MINSSNIRSYINFLHLKKYSAPATEDLKNRWAAVPDPELPSQLQGLYQHWGIDAATAGVYEQQFLQQNTHPNPAPYPGPSYNQPQSSYPQQPYPQQTPVSSYTPPPASASGKSKAPLIIGALVLVAIAGGAAFFLAGNRNEDRTPDTVSTTDTTKPAAAAPVAQSATAPEPKTRVGVNTIYNEEDGTTTDSETDGERAAMIRNLISAEEDRNMSGILDAFATDMEQYWDIRFPTQAELVKRYNAVWGKSSDGKHNHIRIDKVSDNTYDLYADYEFYSNKDHISKAVNVHVRYVFDEDNKILKTYGVK